MDISGCLKMAVLSCWSASLWDSIPLHQPLCPHPLLVPPTSPRQLLLHGCLAAGTMVAGGGGGAWTSRGGSKALTLCLSFLSWVHIGPLTVWGRFTTSGFSISAIMGEVLQEHLCLPLVLVQDPSFIPSSVTTFILPHLSATELHPSTANSWLKKNPWADLCVSMSVLATGSYSELPA